MKKMLNFIIKYSLLGISLAVLFSSSVWIEINSQMKALYIELLSENLGNIISMLVIITCYVVILFPIIGLVLFILVKWNKS